ncbi:hypothetical protein Hdeb2414_s0007g00245301 [Helianthus debilis subsp. tardiflorus]
MCADSNVDILQARATDWHANHNIYCILDENYPNMESFKEIIPFLKESRIFKALTDKHKCYESHVRMFWKSVRYDEQEKTIYSAIRMKDENDKDMDVEVKFTVADVRRVLDLKDSDDDPIIIPERLSKGFWFRMGYAGHVNDKGYIKSRFAGHTSLWPYNISQVLFNHMVDNVKGEKYIMYPRFVQMLLNDQIPNLPKDPADELKLNHVSSETLNRLNKYKGLTVEQEPRVKGMIGKIKNANYVAPKNDHWRHENSNSEDETDSLRGMT